MKQISKNPTIIPDRILVSIVLCSSFFIILYAIHSPMIILNINIKISISKKLVPIIPVYVKNVIVVMHMLAKIPIVFASI